jgi:hypothetical protein
LSLTLDTVVIADLASVGAEPDIRSSLLLGGGVRGTQLTLSLLVLLLARIIICQSKPCHK